MKPPSTRRNFLARILGTALAAPAITKLIAQGITPPAPAPVPFVPTWPANLPMHSGNMRPIDLNEALAFRGPVVIDGTEYVCTGGRRIQAAIYG